MSFHVVWEVIEECHFTIQVVGDVGYTESEDVTILVEILKSSKNKEGGSKINAELQNAQIRVSRFLWTLYP